jgi:hypothetical protein
VEVFKSPRVRKHGHLGDLTTFNSPHAELRLLVDFQDPRLLKGDGWQAEGQRPAGKPLLELPLEVRGRAVKVVRGTVLMDARGKALNVTPAIHTIVSLVTQEIASMVVTRL